MAYVVGTLPHDANMIQAPKKLVTPDDLSTTKASILPTNQATIPVKLQRENDGFVSSVFLQRVKTKVIKAISEGYTQQSRSNIIRPSNIERKSAKKSRPSRSLPLKRSTSEPKTKNPNQVVPAKPQQVKPKADVIAKAQAVPVSKRQRVSKPPDGDTVNSAVKRRTTKAAAKVQQGVATNPKPKPISKNSKAKPAGTTDGFRWFQVDALEAAAEQQRRLQLLGERLLADLSRLDT